MNSLKMLSVLVCLALMSGGCSHDPREVRDKYFNSAEQYFKEGRYEEAAIQYRNALQQDGGHIPSFLGLAKALQQTGEPQAALGLFQQVLKLDGKNVEARLQVAKYLLGAATANPVLFKRAQEEAQTVLGYDKVNVEAMIILGNAYAGQEEIQKSIDMFHEALTADPDNLDASISLGAVLLKNHDVEGSESRFRETVAKHPDSAQAHLALALFLITTKRIQEAEEEYKSAFEIAPDDPNCLRSLANLYMSTNRTAEAENVFLEAIKKRPDAREPRWGLAAFYREQNQVDKEFTVLQELLEMQPTDRQVRLRLAEIYVNRNEDAKAEEIVDSILSANKADSHAHYLKGKVLLRRRDFDNAMTEFDTAIHLSTDRPAPYLDKAYLQMARGDLAGAQNTLREILQRDPNNPLLRGALAKVLAIRNLPQDALREANTVLSSMPDNQDAIAARGEALRTLGRFEESKKDFLKLCNMQPDNPGYWHRLAIVEAQQKDTASALSHLRKALEIQPDFVIAMNEVITLQVNARRYDAALADLDKWAAMEKAPQDEVHNLRGVVYQAMGNPAAAEKEFRSAVEVDPKNYRAYMLLAQLSVQQNNIPKALKDVDQLIATNDRFAPAFLMKAYYLEVAGDKEGAIQNYENTLRLNPENPLAANNLAWLLCESNRDMSRALTLAQSARKALPQNSEIADTLGWIYYKMGNYALAVDQLFFSVGSRVEPKADPYYHLGMAYYQKKDYMFAKQSLERALELDPNFAGAEEARKTLKEISNQ